MPRRIRLSPSERREQLLKLGLQRLSRQSFEQLSVEEIAEEAGISRGLLYHYFDGKQQFRRAVIERAMQELMERTAPMDDPDPLARLLGSLEGYVDYVIANETGYRSILRAAYGGDVEIWDLYQGFRQQLIDRLFEQAGPTAVSEFGFADTPATRLAVLGWVALAETMVLNWVAASEELTRTEMLAMVLGALPGALSATTSNPGVAP